MAHSNSIPGFKSLDYDKVQRDLDLEYGSLEAGYNEAKTRRQNFHKWYRFELYGNEIKGQSTYRDSTIFNAIEWMMPTFVQPFMETAHLIDVQPDGSDINAFVAAQVHKELLQYQIRKKMDWYKFLSDLTKSFFIEGESYGKHVWIKKNVSANEPVSRNEILHIPAAQIRYDWTVRSMEDSYVVTEDKDITRSELISMKNDKKVIQSALKKVLEDHGRNERDSDLSDEQRERSNYVGEHESFRTDANKLYKRREHWTEYDIDGSGIAVPVLAIFVNGVLIKMVKNPYPYNKHPYMKAECVRDPQGNMAIGFAELLAPIQEFKTGIYRMFSDNLNAQNNGMYEVDMNHVDDVGIMMLQKAPAGSRTPIPTRKIGSVQPLTPAPIANHSVTITELLNVEAENRTGFTRYSQGLDSNSLNQTATGISAILQRSEMRMWELAARFAESFLKPMVRRMIMMNQTALTPQELQLQFGLDAVMIDGQEARPAKPAASWIKLNKKDLGGYFSITIDLETPTSRDRKTQDLATWAQYFGSLVPPEMLTQAAVTYADTVGLDQLAILLKESTNGNHFGSRGVNFQIGAAGENGGSPPAPAGQPGF
jgi:hypothetical protein